MGTKYATILNGGVVSTYNDNPPSDDGSQTEANRVKFATITSDLTAPLHSAITSMDGKIVAHVTEGPDAKSTTYTTVAGDHNKTLECTGTFTLSLLNPSTNAGYQTRVKNAGSGTITVDVDGGANVDGVSSITLGAGTSRKFHVNNAGNAYYSTGGYNNDRLVAPAGTDMVFYEDTAPTGWTIVQALDEHVIELTKGSAAAGQTGGAATGTVTSSNWFVSNYATANESSHTHTSEDHNHHWYEFVVGSGSDHNSFDTNGNATALTATVTANASGVQITIKDASTEPTLDTNFFTGDMNGGAGSTGPGTAHNHTIDLRVQRARCIVASKD